MEITTLFRRFALVPGASTDPGKTLTREVAAHLAAAGALAAGLALALAQMLDLPALYVPASLAVFLLVAGRAVSGLAAHHPHRRWGDANRVTLGRGVLISLVGGALAVVPDLATGSLWVLAVLALAALALDGVDGWVARRQSMASAYGARFDMGLDTLLTLLLAVLLWLGGEVGAWVLLMGGLRHIFVAAGRIWPALTGDLPPSQRRRVICVVQIAVLAAGLTPLVAPPVTSLTAGAALALLLFSFAVDTVWLLRHGNPPHIVPSEG